MKKLVLIATVFAALACVVAAWSQGGRPGQPVPGEPGRQFGMGRQMMMSCPAMAVRPPHAGMVDRLAATLQLTKVQAAKLKKIIAADEKKMASLQQVAAKASQALRTALFAAKYDAKSVKALSIKAEKSEAAVISASIDEWTQVRSVLTSKQSANLEKAMQSQRHGPGGPGFGAPGFRPASSGQKGPR